MRKTYLQTSSRSNFRDVLRSIERLLPLAYRSCGNTFPLVWDKLAYNVSSCRGMLMLIERNCVNNLLKVIEKLSTQEAYLPGPFVRLVKPRTIT